MTRAEEYQFSDILNVYADALRKKGATDQEIKFQRLVIHNFVKNILPGLGFGLVRINH